MRFLSLLLLITGFAPVCSAQVASASLHPETVTMIVDKLVAGLDDYVIPERAATLKGYLRAHLGEYHQIHSPEALADRLTTDLRAIGQDKHLTIWYAPPTDGSEVQTGPTEEQMRHVMEARAFGVSHIARLPGNIGYLRLDFFIAAPDAAPIANATMTLLHGSDALILDLRANHGGSPDMVDQLISYFVESRIQLTSIVWRDGGTTHVDEQWTSAEVSGPRFLHRPIYVLTSANTFSAGEQFSYDLKTLKLAMIVGETTGGGANPSNKPHPLGAGFDAFIPNGQAKNPITHANWEGVGVAPDIPAKASDALVTAYVQALKTAKPEVMDFRLQKSRDDALENPAQALRNAGFGPS